VASPKNNSVEIQRNTYPMAEAEVLPTSPLLPTPTFIDSLRIFLPLARVSLRHLALICYNIHGFPESFRGMTMT
jgi:hypothetical protein